MAEERHQTHHVLPSSPSQDAPVHSYPPSCHRRPIIPVTQHEAEALGMPSEPSSVHDSLTPIHSPPVPSVSTAPEDNTRPRYRVSCYRLVSAIFLLGFGVPKAIAASKNEQVTATTLDWISGVSLSLFIMVAGWWEQDPPSRLRWFFDTDWTPRKPNWEVYRDATSNVLSEWKKTFPNFEIRTTLQIFVVVLGVWGYIARDSWVTKLGESHSSLEHIFLWYDRVSSTFDERDSP
ncbi:hypothetical protein JAAARDRAFT_211221 [Jaapia argillacea MUCL 33604]|uniref:Uncharacterized protein n=1 Tax=Jaapia argillacea MUCL 33604 TaxID=933084 RepID=A0A067PJR1_9AGAM|nr:hypothetical protein JAAARDRAFT_211221 [Jaapia argillacea MUCL 33604]